jgi:ABC-type phosphate transport system substrate-binding protein
MQSWPDGSPLTVFALNDESDAHRTFCRTVLGVLPYHLRRNWDRLIFSGSGQAPTLVSNMQQMKMKVAATPGAIGYIDRDSIDESIAVINVNH